VELHTFGAFSVLKKGLSGRLSGRLNVFGLKPNRTWRKRSNYSAIA